jgi:uncharacterized protein with gpF-like domain
MTEAQYYQQYMRNLMKLEKPFAAQFRASLNKMMTEAAAAAEHGQPREAKNIVKRFEKEQQAILQTRYASAASVFGRLIDGAIEKPEKKEIKAKLSDSFWQAILKWSKSEAASKIVKISRTSERMIAAAVSAGIDAGESNWTIAERIRDLKKVSDSRAMLIARTETHNAAGKAADVMSADMKFKQEKKWLAASDERTRTSHANVGSTDWIDANEKFNVGGTSMDHPGDSAGGPENICNCRCAVMYRRKK